MTDKPRSNVINFANRLKDLREETSDSVFFPTEEEFEAFLSVLDFIRRLSTSRTGHISFTSEDVTIILQHFLNDEVLNEYGLSKHTALHEEVNIAFPLETSLEIQNGLKCDLVDGLDSLVAWMNPEQE